MRLSLFFITSSIISLSIFVTVLSSLSDHVSISIKCGSVSVGLFSPWLLVRWLSLCVSHYFPEHRASYMNRVKSLMLPCLRRFTRSLLGSRGAAMAFIWPLAEPAWGWAVGLSSASPRVSAGSLQWSAGPPPLPGLASSPWALDSWLNIHCRVLGFLCGLVLAALAASKSSEYLEEEAGRLQGSVFIPSLLTGILAPHVSTFCSSILVRRQAPWWGSLPLSCSLWMGPSFRSKSCRCWLTSACGFPSAPSCPLSPGCLSGSPVPSNWTFGGYFPQIFYLFLVEILVCHKLLHHSWEGSLL